MHLRKGGSGRAQKNTRVRVSSQTEYKEKWAFIKKALDVLFTDSFHSEQKGVPYMELFDYIWNMTAVTKPNHMEDIFFSMHGYLEQFTQDKLKELSGTLNIQSNEQLLEEYHQIWTNYDIGAQVSNNLCQYVNKHFPATRGAGSGSRKTVPNVDPEVFSAGVGRTGDHVSVMRMAYVMFRNKLFAKFKDRLIKSVIDLVERARKGEDVAERSIGSVVQSVIRLGPINSPLQLYETEIEAPYLENVEQFYKTASASAMASMSTAEYIGVADKWLDTEEERAKTILQATSVKKVTQICVKSAVVGHMDTLQDEIEILVTNKKVNTLQSLFKLLKRIDGPDSHEGTQSLLTCLQNQVTTQGESLLKEVGLASVQVMQKDDPQNFVDTLLKLHETFFTLCTEAFFDDKSVIAAIDMGLTTVVNKHPKAPDMLARYCDLLLRSGSRISKELEGVRENAVEKRLGEIVLLFKYIEDKDVFQAHYRSQLAKRLMLKQSASDDFEQHMISLLKRERGYEFVTKMQRMFTDMSLAHTLNTGFLSTNKKKLPIGDVSVLVLTSNSWPLKQLDQKESIINAPQFDETIKLFTQYYGKLHQSKNLRWLFHECRADLKTKFTTQPKELACTHYQAMILLLYNRSVQYRFKEIMASTQIGAEPLKHAISVLIDEGLLLVEGSNATQKAEKDMQKKGKKRRRNRAVDLADDSVVTLNLKYIPKNRKVKVNLCRVAADHQASAEDASTRKDVDGMRELKTQAAIVRIMKANKTKSHNDLIQDVIRLINDFQPNVGLIKKMIEVLIEKEYMCRVEGKHDQYEYMA